MFYEISLQPNVFDKPLPIIDDMLIGVYQAKCSIKHHVYYSLYNVDAALEYLTDIDILYWYEFYFVAIKKRVCIPSTSDIA